MGGVGDESITSAIVAGSSNSRGEAGHIQLGQRHRHYSYGVQGR